MDVLFAQNWAFLAELKLAEIKKWGNTWKIIIKK